MTSVPKEVCELKPLKVCTNEVVSLPSLELVNECVQVPKEVCSLEKVNPRQVARPIIKKWCQSSSKDPYSNNFIEIQTSTNQLKCKFNKSVVQVTDHIYDTLNPSEEK